MSEVNKKEKKIVEKKNIRTKAEAQDGQQQKIKLITR